jgi:hypothetical protein
MEQELELIVSSAIRMEWTEFKEYFIPNKKIKSKSFCNSRVSMEIICDLCSKNISVKCGLHSCQHEVIMFPFLT